MVFLIHTELRCTVSHTSDLSHRFIKLVSGDLLHFVISTECKWISFVSFVRCSRVEFLSFLQFYFILFLLLLPFLPSLPFASLYFITQIYKVGLGRYIAFCNIKRVKRNFFRVIYSMQQGWFSLILAILFHFIFSSSFSSPFFSSSCLFVSNGLLLAQRLTEI